ncbi:MAG: trimethylamine methyltransferase family protein, partial [Desulfobacterales bacterium]|nr:trimethylamine methyltransferase family protein [Desulfobacterales bacterium]
YLGAGMICSPEMLVMGDEICAMTRHLLRGMTVNADTLATEVIDQVGPGGNFLQAPHTFKHFKKETWFPTIMEREYQEKWTERGKPTIQDKVRDKLSTILDTHTPVPLGDHEWSELERLRAEGETVLAKAAAQK